RQFHFAGLKCNRLVFVDGIFSSALSTLLPQKPGVELGSLASALARDAAGIQKHLGSARGGEQNAFAALNTAFFLDGAFINVPAGLAVTGPVHLLFISTSTEAGATSHRRNLIIAGKESRLTVLESYVST